MKTTLRGNSDFIQLLGRSLFSPPQLLLQYAKSSLHILFAITLAFALLGCGSKPYGATTRLQGSYSSPSPAQFHGAILMGYVDHTPTVVNAPSASASNKEMTNLFQGDLLQGRSPVYVELRSSSRPGHGEPEMRYTERLDKSLLPRQKKARMGVLIGQWDTSAQAILSEPPVHGETRLIEDLYLLARRSGQLTGAKEAYRAIFAVSDMGQYSKLIKASSLLLLEDKACRALVQRLLKQYPPLQLPPHKMTFVFVLAQEDFEHDPARIERLKSFWSALLKGWGISDVEFIEPHAQSGERAENSSGPFTERKSMQENPTLTVTNDTDTNDLLVLRSERGQSYRLSLPRHKAQQLALSAGVYQFTHSSADGKRVYSQGHGRFRGFKRYDTSYVEGTSENHAPITFGEVP